MLAGRFAGQPDGWRMDQVVALRFKVPHDDI